MIEAQTLKNRKSVPLERLIPLLQRVEKPGRYVGGEFGIAPKNPHNMDAMGLLIYPDTYELGMSNQGLKILYDCINRNEHLLADRAFLPWPDFGDAIQKEKIPFYSLDHFIEAKDFDMWGFNVCHELHYTNLLYFMELAHIPFLRTERDDNAPIIIAGGTAVSNPLPLFDFMDGIFIGDGEEAIVEILTIIANLKKSGHTRKDILNALSQVKGLVLPHLFCEEIDIDGRVMMTGSLPVEKRLYRAELFTDLTYIPIPNIQVTQDRAVLEVARGCGQGCRFCHAGFWKRPVRNSQVELLVECADRLLQKTGSNSISLHSLSLADYPYLEELVFKLNHRFSSSGISLSFPSLRVDGRTLPVIESTSSIRKSGITFALEAGSDYLRERIHKKSSEVYLHQLIKQIFGKGWELVKVYFMLGLPDPEGKEIDDLIDALNRLGDLARDSGKTKSINVTISLFVPKPFTTFQWEKLQTPEYFHSAMNRIRSELKTKRVNIKSPEPEMSWVEGILSRADHRAGALILSAYQHGAKFDSWDDKFKKDTWLDLIHKCDPRWIEEWSGPLSVDKVTAWERVVDGFSRERLQRDYEKYSAITRENMNPATPPDRTLADTEKQMFEIQPVSIPDEKFRVATILEIDYARTWPFYYISHLDTAEVFRKMFRRIRLPLTFSQGFNKHERLHFGSSLPLFVSSDSEKIYADLYSSVNVDDVKRQLEQQLPLGVSINQLQFVDRVPAEEKIHRYQIGFYNKDQFEQAHHLLNHAPEMFCYEKKERKKKRMKRGESPIKRMEKRLKSALGEIVTFNDELSKQYVIEFNLENPNGTSLSFSDLMREYLNIQPEEWNVSCSIKRMRVH